MTVRKRAIRKTMTTNGQITAMPLCADIGILHTALLQEVAWLRDIAEMLREDVARAVSVLSVAECLCRSMVSAFVLAPFFTVFL